MKKKIVTIVIFLVFLLTIPLALVLVGFCTPAQFDETYYGELGHMYDRLQRTEGKKIVLIGNSGLAFGVRTDLMQAEFPDYAVVEFALYGAIGTKAMLDLSKVNISEGDIVIVAPERLGQSQSLYFSAENLWMAADGNFSMLRSIAGENQASMAGNFLHYVAQKYKYFRSGSKPAVSGVYMQAAFNDKAGEEVGYMTYEREYNVMPGGYDENNPVDFTGGLSEEFADYLNAYNRYVRSKGATLYYGFTSVNVLGLTDGTDEGVLETHLNTLKTQLDFRIIGSPGDYVMDYEWFYDTNFHVNSAGMYAYTHQLVEDLKAELGISTENSIVIPEKPQVKPQESVEGDNSDVDCFTYEDYLDGVRVTGLTEEGRGKNSFIIPATYDGKPVISFAASVFAGNTKVTEITVPANVRTLYDNSFQGCTRLTRLVLVQENPNAIGVGTQLLSGADNCNVYVKREVYDLFSTHYNWGAYEKEKRLFAY